jgi:hypothetical protein
MNNRTHETNNGAKKEKAISIGPNSKTPVIPELPVQTTTGQFARHKIHSKDRIVFPYV